MGSLLVRATFGERVVGRFALRSGKRSSENGVQTTFWLGRRGAFKKNRVLVSKQAHTWLDEGDIGSDIFVFSFINSHVNL